VHQTFDGLSTLSNSIDSRAAWVIAQIAAMTLVSRKYTRHVGKCMSAFEVCQVRLLAPTGARSNRRPLAAAAAATTGLA